MLLYYNDPWSVTQNISPLMFLGGHTGLIQSSGGAVTSGGGCQSLGSGAGGRVAVYHTTVQQVSKGSCRETARIAVYHTTIVVGRGVCQEYVSMIQSAEWNRG